MNNTPSIDTIVDRVCHEYHITKEQLTSRKRTPPHAAQARQMLCYILVMKLDVSWQECGALIGGRTTARYLSEEGRNKIRRYQHDREIYERVWLGK